MSTFFLILILLLGFLITFQIAKASEYVGVLRGEKKNFSQINYFQNNIAHGKPSNWRCRAGARYLYICEDGLVHYCSQQRGYPAKPLADYTVDDIRREYLTEKSCAPMCTISCVRQISYFDFWRDPQTIASTAPSTGHDELVQIQSGGN